MKPASVIREFFSPIIGQSTPKERLSEILIGPTVEGGYMAPVLIIAPPGVGKTKLLRAIQSIVKKMLGRKTIFFPSGEEMGSSDEFFDDVLIPHVHEKECVMFIDEFQDAASHMRDMVRRMIDITVERHSHVVSHGDKECVIDPKRLGIVIATNEIDKVPAALLSRCERIDLDLYTDDEMEQILFQSLDGLHFHENTLRKIAECNRGSARDIVHWVNAIRRHAAIAGKKTLNREDVCQIIRKRETFPYGISKNELKTLLLLERFGDQQLKELSAKNHCQAAEQNSNETYLRARNFIEIGIKRHLTKDGREYLAELRKDGFLGPVTYPTKALIS